MLNDQKEKMTSEFLLKFKIDLNAHRDKLTIVITYDITVSKSYFKIIFR
ncbi:MAG: hypothetical protein QG657_4333 [Acidobacteriota bacterium]|nr:hypothetical protein [Acidobacteriota bacterium]